MSIRIVVLVEGATEAAFKSTLLAFLAPRLAGRMPRLTFSPQDGRIPKGEQLKRIVERWLERNDAVIALTDVYTGTSDFNDAAHAKRQMQTWVGPNDCFHPHAAQHDFEAWLLPYWSIIQRKAGSSRSAPSRPPEQVNHGNPPSRLLGEVFSSGSSRRAYVKTRDGAAILRDQDLSIAAAQCPELKAFLNTILNLSGGQPL